MIKLIKEFELQNSICDVNTLNFRQFCDMNKNYYIGYKSLKKIKFKNYQKVNIMLDLLSVLRNRSYHWENISKMKKTKNNNFVPRLSTNFQKTIISVQSNKIETFLDFIINSINKDLKDKI